MPTVCEILGNHGFRIEDLERRLAAIRLYSTSQEGVNFFGATWQVSGDQIAVWSTTTNLPLSWSQGKWARLKAGKIEARGDAFTFKSSDTGARIEIDGTELAGYDSGGTKQFYLSASDGKAYFAGGNAVMDAEGIILSAELIVKRETTETANQTDRGMYLSILADPASASSTIFLGLRTRADVVAGCAESVANLTGATIASRHYGTGAIANMEGGYGVASLYTSGGSTPFASGWSGSTYVATGTTITKSYNLWARTQAVNTGTITTAHGLFVDAVYGTTKYGIWQDGANDLNVFKGSIWLDNKLYFDEAKTDSLEYDTSNNWWKFKIGGVEAFRLEDNVLHINVGKNAAYSDIKMYDSDTEHWAGFRFDVGSLYLTKNSGGDWTEIAAAGAPGAHAASHEDGAGDEIDLTAMSGDEIRLVPQAASTGPEGTLFYCSTDDYVYVATEA